MYMCIYMCIYIYICIIIRVRVLITNINQYIHISHRLSCGQKGQCILAAAWVMACWVLACEPRELGGTWWSFPKVYFQGSNNRTRTCSVDFSRWFFSEIKSMSWDFNGVCSTKPLFFHGKFGCSKATCLPWGPALRRRLNSVLWYLGDNICDNIS